MNSFKNFLQLLSTIIAFATLNMYMMSCNTAPCDGGKKVFLSKCIVYDNNNNNLLINNGDSAILSNEFFLLINDRLIKVDDNFVKKYCHEDINDIKNDISPIENKEGNGKYVELEKEREFDDKCLGKNGKGIVTFSGAKFECFQIDDDSCSKHSRPLLILGSSSYHPHSSVKANEMRSMKLEEKNRPIYPEEFFIYNDSLYVRFYKDDSLSVRIYYGLQTEVVKDITADGNLHIIPIENGADTFRIASPNRLSYLICATHPNSELVIFDNNSATLNSELCSKHPKYPWYIWLCIIIVFIELVISLFVIIRIICYSNTIKNFIKNFDKKNEQKIRIKRMELPDNLSKVKFIACNINKKRINQKVMLCGMIQIEKSIAQKYVDYLFENYYPKKDQALSKYLEDQTRDAELLNEFVTLKVPFYIKDCLSNDCEDKWVENKKLGVYRKSLPNFDIINTDVQQEKLDNVIEFNLDASYNCKMNSWEQLQDTIAKMSELVPENLNSMVGDISAIIDSIKKEHSDFVNVLRESLKNASENLSKQEILLGTEKANNKQLKLKIESLQLDFNEKLNEKIYGIKEELEKTRENFEVTNRKLIETNGKFEKLKDDHKKIEKELHELTKQKKAVDKELSGIKNEHQKEIQRIESQHKEVLDKTERSFNALLKHQKEEFERAMSDYVRLFSRYAGCEAYTNYAKQFFDLLAQLQQAQMNLFSVVSAREIDDVEKDNFNYYFTAVANKFNKAINGLKVDEYSKELVDLDETGMTRTGKVIDKILKTSTKEKYVDDLRYRVYEDLFRQLCGAAIVLSDDLGSLHSLCPQAVHLSDVTQFQELTEQLLHVTLDMGYKPVYVKLFTSYSDYEDISVEKTVNLEGTKKNDVTEVLSMAVNYGTHKDKTKVSANI